MSMAFSSHSERHLQRLMAARLQRLALRVGLEEVRNNKRLVNEHHDVKAEEAIRRLRSVEAHYRNQLREGP